MGDLRVEVKLDLSLPIPGVDFAHVKPAITLSGVDPDGDVEAQIARGLETADRMLVAVDEHIEVAIQDIIAGETGAPGYRERLGAVEDLNRKVRDRLNETIRKVGEIHERLLAVEGESPAPGRGAEVQADGSGPEVSGDS